MPALLHLAHTEGASGLYAGLGTACVTLSISNLLYYSVYALLRDAVLKRSQRTSLGGAAALPVAALAGALNVVATNPLWVLVTRLQAHHKSQPSTQPSDGPPVAAASGSNVVQVARQVYSEGGLPAFWRGTGASLVMVANPVVQFAAYEWLMARAVTAAAAAAAKDKRLSKLPSAWIVFTAGALSKLAATLVTYPFLLLKSRQQAGSGAAATHEQQLSNAGGVIRARLLAQLLRVAREEGVQGVCAPRTDTVSRHPYWLVLRALTLRPRTGLYRGLDTKLAQTVLAAAILFTTKESCTNATRRVLRRRNRAALKTA